MVSAEGKLCNFDRQAQDRGTGKNALHKLGGIYKRDAILIALRTALKQLENASQNDSECPPSDWIGMFLVFGIKKNPAGSAGLPLENVCGEECDRSTLTSSQQV
jgi:hypothetical protein